MQIHIYFFQIGHVYQNKLLIFLVYKLSDSSKKLNFTFYICDVIKQNESELANTVYKIQLNNATSFFCFLLFFQSFFSLYLAQLPWDFHQIKA